MFLSGCTSSVQKNSEEVHIILMAGQSNMAGAGNFNAIDEISKKRLAQLSKQITIVSKNQNIQKSNKPFYVESAYHLKKYGFERTFGPELPMLLALNEQHPKQKYIVIKTAYGGTSLHGAWNPNWTLEKAQVAEKGKYKQSLKLFSEHITQIHNTLGYLEQQGTSYKILGLGWLQGEADTGSALKADSYHQNLTNLIAAYRTELEQPKLKVVIAQINMAAKKYLPGTGKVRAAQSSVALADPLVNLIPTSLNPSWHDYPKHFDNVHYNTIGQTRFGKAFAKAFLSY
jgi:hypothetical protein